MFTPEQAFAQTKENGHEMVLMCSEGDSKIYKCSHVGCETMLIVDGNGDNAIVSGSALSFGHFDYRRMKNKLSNTTKESGVDGVMEWAKEESKNLIPRHKSMIINIIKSHHSDIHKNKLKSIKKYA